MGGGGGCHKFVPFLGGDGTKIAPLGDLFDQPPGEISRIRGKLADHVGDNVVLSPEGIVLVPRGRNRRIPAPPNRWSTQLLHPPSDAAYFSSSSMPSLTRPSSPRRDTEQLICTTEEGEILLADWRARAGAWGRDDDIAGGGTVGNEDVGGGAPEFVKWVARDHTRPCVALDKSPFFPGVLLTVGDWSFQIWKVIKGARKDAVKLQALVLLWRFSGLPRAKDPGVPSSSGNSSHSDCFASFLYPQCLGGANPAVNTPRPSRGTRIESCDFIVLIGDP